MIKYLSLNNIDYSEEPKKSYLNYKIILWSISFALIFVNLPWEIIKGAEFTDIENYIRRFKTDFNVNSLISQGGLLNYITSEYLWAALIVSLKEIGMPILLIFKSISFFSIFVISYFVFKRSQKFFLTSLLLLNPLLIDFVMSQIRNSFALAVIILGMLCHNKWAKIALLICSTMIHSSSVIIISIIFLLNKITSKRNYRDFGMLLLIALIFAIGLSVGREYILTLIGDRRSDITQPQSSILYSLFWVIYILLLLYLKKFITENIYLKMAFVLIIVFFASVIFGTYASRYLAILLPFLIVATMSLNSNNRKFSSGILLFYQFILFTYWIN